MNLYFQNGVSLEDWLVEHGLHFIDLNETDLWCEDGYLQVFSTPFFNLTKAHESFMDFMMADTTSANDRSLIIDRESLDEAVNIIDKGIQRVEKMSKGIE